jgi:hypothetical protein
MKVAVCSYASACHKFGRDKSQRYFKYAERLRDGLTGVDFYLFTENNLDHPNHSEVPYAFKPYAIDKLRKEYDIVIWADSCVYAIKPIDKFIEYIKINGFAFFDNIGFRIGDYTSDECLNNLGMSRDESFNHPMIMACLMGFNFTNEKAVKLFDAYYQATKIKGCYEGDWSNQFNQVSQDNRVKGHRHDQSVMSVLLAKEKIKPLHPHSTFFAYYGNPGHLPHAQTVCLLSQGF